MAKIKSTLDLVMERTKNIAVSQEDREALRRKECEDKVRGWVAMLRDGKLTTRELIKEYSAESSRYSPLTGILRSELLRAIDPDADNSSIIQALTQALHMDLAPVADSIKDYHARYEVIKGEHLGRLKSTFKDMGISGTALVPNLDQDETWIATVNSLKEQFSRKILAG